MGLEGMNLPSTMSAAVTPISMYAKFSSRREAPHFMEAIGYAGDMVNTATNKYAERFVQVKSNWVTTYIPW